MTDFNTSLVWFRRDLRCFDHAALYHALSRSERVLCVFIFDRAILDPLPRADRRVEFIHASILELDAELRKAGGALIVRHADAATEIVQLAQQFKADAVFVNHDYEPQAIARDTAVAKALKQSGISLLSFKDQVIFEKDEVLSQSQKPFSVFTPYKNAWLKKIQFESGADADALPAYQVESMFKRLHRSENTGDIPTLQQLGFQATNLNELQIPTGMSGAQTLFEDFLPRIGDYDTARDFPGIKGPSYLSVHLRFGTVSIRALARRALEEMRTSGGRGAAVWLSELIWRDFYFMILYHHPYVTERAFKPEYDAIVWQSGARGDELFDAWCNARTGYPLVDAAMRQINQTGYMHNRLRMVTACFLIKDCGIHWQRGERYFAEQLNDYDLSANNGGWQWAASSGCDAQPYFRIFNPITQSEKFDADGKFIRRYVPELAQLSNKEIHAPWLASADKLRAAGVVLGENYPQPIVQHDEARQATLERYQVVKKVGSAAPN